MQSKKELIQIIMQSESTDVLNSDLLQEVSFVEYLENLLMEHNVSKIQLLNGICMERSYGYQILNGRRIPTRIIILRIAIFLHLDLYSTQELLSLGKKEALYPRKRFDAAVIYAIGHNYDLSKTEELLEAMGEKSIFGEG